MSESVCLGPKCIARRSRRSQATPFWNSTMWKCASTSVRFSPASIWTFAQASSYPSPGPNGAGKSTMLNAITSDVPITGGSITLFGEPLAAWDATELAMRRSVLMQNVDVTFPFSVGDIVCMGRSPWEGTPQEMDDDMIVGSAMGITEVTPLEDPRVHVAIRRRTRARRIFPCGLPRPRRFCCSMSRLPQWISSIRKC